MPDIITCTPRTLPPERVVAAAEKAVDINPQNRSALEDLAGVLPDFVPTPEALAVTTAKYWGAGGVRLTVGFLDNPGADLRARILGHMNAWGDTANIEFVETADAEGAQVRINRELMPQPEWNGYWSFLGTDILMFEGPNGQTMNLQEFTMNTSDREFFRVVRHEAGHTLGFPHEHMRRELVERIDRQKAIDFYKRLTGWSEAQIIRQVLTPLEESSLIGTSVADPDSIMAYQVPGQVTIDGEPIPGGLDISLLDREFVALIYPQPEEPEEPEEPEDPEEPEEPDDEDECDDDEDEDDDKDDE